MKTLRLRTNLWKIEAWRAFATNQFWHQIRETSQHRQNMSESAPLTDHVIVEFAQQTRFVKTWHLHMQLQIICGQTQTLFVFAVNYILLVILEL